MSRKGLVFMAEKKAGLLEETERGYKFAYFPDYLTQKESKAVSLTLPLSSQPYESSTLFPFFDGLIPEGWLLEISVSNWKLNPRDRMGLLLAVCRDCVGAVSVIPVDETFAKENAFHE